MWLQYSGRRLVSICPPRKGILSNFYHVINSDDDDDDDDDDDFSFNDASIHEGHLCQNGILTLFGIERAKKVSHMIKFEKKHNTCMALRSN